VAAGTATPVETSEYQAYIDWEEYYGAGVNASQLSFQTIAGQDNNVAWQSDPFISEMEAAINGSPAGGATETAAGGELLSAVEDAGLIAPAEESLGAMCLATAPCVVAGLAAGVGLVAGHFIYDFFNDDSSASTSGVGSTVVSVTAEEKVWVTPQYQSCGANGWTGWQPLMFEGSRMTNFQTSSGAPSTYEAGDNNGQGSPLPGAVVPCTGSGASSSPQTGPGGGVWLLIGTMVNPAPAPSPSKWAGLWNADCVYSATSPCVGCQNNGPETFTAPAPQTTEWTEITWTDNNYASCTDVTSTSQQTFTDTFQSAEEYKTRQHEHVGFPRQGTCTVGSTYGRCVQATTQGSGAWCVTATCASSAMSTYPNLRQFLNHAIGVQSGGSTTPAPGTVAVPSGCVGATPAVCKTLLQQAGFTAAPAETTLTPAQADLTKPAGAVVTTAPAAGTYVDTGTVVTLDENPTPLPLAIPAPLSGGETYSAYIARLRTLGFVGTINEVDVPESQIDTSVGPQDVVQTNPAEGTQVAPSTQITVEANPSDAPPATGSGSAPVGPTLPGIMLPGAPTPCTVFPFGVPCWLKNQLGSFVSATPQAPSFSIGTPALFGGGSIDVNLDHPFGADLSSIMAVVRVVLLAVSMIGLVVWLAGFALGGSTGGSGGGAESES